MVGKERLENAGPKLRDGKPGKGVYGQTNLTLFVVVVCLES